jgi:O-antigen/teichoic acid export membrane protein
MSREIANKAVRNFLFNGGRLVITMGATVCTSAIIARTLGPTNMGVYGYATWIVGTLGILANLGLPGALTKYIAEYMGSGDLATAARVGKGLLLTQLIIATSVSGLMACFMLFHTPYQDIIGIAAILLLVQALQQSVTSALAGIQRFDRLALISLYVALASVASIAVAAFLHAGVTGMLWATVIGPAAAILMSYRDINKFLLKSPQSASPPVSGASDPFRRIRKFSLTVSYILLVDAIVWQRSEILFLKAYSTVAQIGFYTIAYSMASKLNDITGTFSTTLMPLYAETYGRNGLRDVGLVFANAAKYLQMLMVPLCLLGIAVARPLVLMIYGPQFLSVALPLQILLASLPIICIGVVISPVLYGVDKQSFIAKYGTVVAVLNIVLDLVLIPKYAAVGAAYANCAAQIAGVVGGAFYVIRYVGVTFPWKSSARIYAAAAVAVAPAAYVGSYAHSPAQIVPLMEAIAAAGLLYVTVLIVIGELGRQDLNLLKRAVLAKAHPPKPVDVTDAA